MSREPSGSDQTSSPFSARHTLLARTLDSGADGTIDAAESYSWDAGGSLLEFTIDWDGDQVTDATVRYKYVAGRLVRRDFYGYRTDDCPQGEGEPDGFDTLEYDAQGNLVHEEHFKSHDVLVSRECPTFGPATRVCVTP